jgi:hypothetical protein
LTASGGEPSHVLVSNFLHTLQGAIGAHGLPAPTEEMKRCIVRIGQALLPLDMPRIPAAPTGSENYAEKKIELEAALHRIHAYNPLVAQQALAWSVLQFLLAVPRPEHPLWNAPARGIISIGPTIVQMMMPFYRAAGTEALFNTVRERYEQGARIAQEKSKAKEWVWPEHYTGPDAITLYLLPEFQELFDCEVPYGHKDERRFEHQWLMAAPGYGKTTLLSAYIQSDLERVARNECSVLVMDSQNTLCPDIARLKCFAPGQPMHDRLIYIEPSVKFPPALNIFARDAQRFSALDEDEQYALNMSTLEMMDFFLSSMLNLTLTDKQNIPFRFIIQALLQIPKATIFTLHRLLQNDGYARFRDDLRGLDPEVTRWFQEHYRKRERGEGKDIFTESREEVAYRIEALYADPLFSKMLGYPERKLDLFTELQQGKVIVINTLKGRLRRGVEPWGRFFLAQLLQAVEERSLVLRERTKPTFAYIDEGGDYIAREHNIKTIFTQARKQKVGMTIAHHYEDDIQDPRVMAALRGAGIRISPVKRGVFEFAVREEPTRIIDIPNVQFHKADLRMTDEEWEIVLAEQRRKYCVPPALRESPRTGQEREDSFDEA